MTKKSTVSKAIKKTEGKQKSKNAVVSKKEAARVPVNGLAQAGTNQVDLKRQLKIQKALYEIAEAASAARDMQSFYKKLHKIVGTLMYAKNFFIALHDKQSDLITWPYHVAEKDTDDLLWPSEKLAESKTGTAWIIRTGRIHQVRFDLEGLLESGEIEIGSINTPPVDGIGVPLKVGRNVLGVLVVQSYVPSISYDEQDVQVLTFAAQHIATALTRARALEAERQRTDELAILNSVGEAMAKTLAVKTVTKIVGDKVQAIFAAEAVTIRLYDPTTRLIQRAYDYERGYTDLTDTSFSMGQGLTSKIIESGKPLLFGTGQDMDNQGALNSPSSIPNQSTQSFIGVPIVIGNNGIGVVTVQSYKQHAYNESHVHLLETLASNIGVAIQNARLFQAEQERVAELQIINSIQQGLAAELDFQAIVDLVGDKLREVFNTPNMAIRWYDDKSNIVHFLYEYEHGIRLNIPPQPPTPGGTFDLFLKNRQPIVANTAELAARTGGTVLAGTDLSKSIISVPIITSDRLIGSLQIENYERENAFGESELRLLTTIAASLGTALENARLFDEVQKKNAEITEALEQQTATSAVLRAMSGFQPDLRSLLEIIAINVAKVCGANDAHIYRLEGNKLMEWTHRGPIPGLEDGESLPLNRGSVIGRAIVDRQIVHIRDAQVELKETEYPVSVSLQRRWGYRTVLAIPLLRDGEPIGGIAIRREEVQPFTDKQIALIKTFADQAVIAIENVRLFDETQRLLKDTQQRNAELAIINSVQSALASKLDYQGVIEAVGDKLRQIFPKESIVGIGIVDREHNLTRIPYMFDRAEGKVYSGEFPLDQGLAAIVIRTGKTLLINSDLERRSQELGAVALGRGESQMKSYLCVPILVGNEAIGGINLQSSERENAYAESDVRLLETLANSMSVALENARLFDETQRLLKITEDRAAELAIINSVQAALAAELNIQGIYDAIGDKIREIFHNTDLSIRTFDAKANLVHWVYMVENGERIRANPTTLTTGFSAHVFRTRETVVINEKAAQEMEKYGSFILPGTHAPKSSIFVPLVVGDQARGLIALDNYEREHAFNESDVRLLQTVANAMSVALENARLFDETQRLLKITEERAEELAIINSIGQTLTEQLDLNAMVERVGDKLQKALKLKNIGIGIYNENENVMQVPFIYRDGRRLTAKPFALNPFNRRVSKAGRSLIVNKDAKKLWLKFGGISATDEIPRSFIMVPLMAGRELVGGISLQDFESENAFDNLSIGLLETIASNMGTAILNARLFDETQRLLKETEQRAAELAIINSVQEGLASKLDMHAIYELIGEKLTEITGADIVVIAERYIDEQTRADVYTLEKGTRRPASKHPFTPLEKFVIPDLQQGKTIVWNDGMEERVHQFGHGDVVGDTGVPRSVLIVPLKTGKTGGNILTTISLQNSSREQAFSDSDIRLVETLANSMSVALENARLSEEIQNELSQQIQAKEREEHRRVILEKVIRTGQRVTEVHDVRTTLMQIWHGVNDDLNFDRVGIYLFNPERNSMDGTFGTNNQGEMIDEWHTSISLEKDTEEARSYLQVIEKPDAILLTHTYASDNNVPEGHIMSGVQDFAAIAAWAGTKPVAVICVDHQITGRRIMEEQLEALRLFAGYVGLAIENARLFDETQRLLKETEQRAAELAIINSVQVGLASKLEVQAIYDLVGEKLRGLFDMQSITLVEFDMEKHTRHYRYLFEKGQHFEVPDASIAPISQYIIRTRQPLWINERFAESMAALGLTSKTIPGTEPTKSMVRVPIFIGGQVHGVIGLDNLDHENAFSTSDVRLLQTLASSLSVALENARLFEETKRNAAELATVNTVSSALASELDVSTLINLVGEQARSIFKADIVYVALLNEDNNTINFPYTHGEEQIPMRYGEGLTSRIIQTGKPLLINSDIDRKTQQIGATIVGVQSLSYLGVPIMMGGKAVGVVSVQSASEENAFDEADQRLLSTIAANVGSALHNARLYKEAQESRAAAEQANKAKSTFLANMSHELRTPLNAIIGFTRIVRKKSDSLLPQKQLENLDKVLTSSEHLLGLINTVLDIAKIEAGRMDVIAGNFSIGALADQCANLATPLLKPNVTLGKQVDVNLGIIYSDQDKIKQIVLNLLSNAAKFTHEGKITLAVEKCDEDTIRISVSDSGIGISEEALSRIFDEFQQADTSTTRQYGGTGLGLAISRNLARLLGGDLTATSEPGKGSTFSLTIPMQYGKKATARADALTLRHAQGDAARSTGLKPDTAKFTGSYSQVDSAKKRVLVIDDDPDAAYLLQESLSQNEFTVIGAPNGRTGFQLAKETRPDAILLDILMPETDGWQVLNDLKMDEATMDIPVVLLTIVDKKALGFKLGAAAYLLKPLHPTVVLDALRRVIGEKEHPHKHVLVVDDDPNIAEMLRQTLSEEDFVLASAEDGEAGLRAIEARRPDVILLDLMMPKLDGFGVIERLRLDPELRNIPIVVISAKDLSEEESKTLKESVAFVMKKQGFKGDLLMEEINSVMKK
jgi:GAF domain-containing protein/DNA-binding response OmpR family regulator